MSTFDSTLVVSIVSICDRNGCEAREEWPVYGPDESIPANATIAARHAFEAEARAAFSAWRAANGWTYWAGSRVPATLCPAHKPGPTSIKMQNYTQGQSTSPPPHHPQPPYQE